MSSTCSVPPRELVSVAVAAEQVGAHPQTLLTRSTFMTTSLKYPLCALSCCSLGCTTTGNLPERISVMTTTYSASGTVSIQDTNYTIPTGAYFVANTGSDSNPGTQAAPWLTVGHAISTAAAGSTIVLRAGIYREGNISIGKQLTLQPYPHEQAWLLGSVVVGDGYNGYNWVQSGTSWCHGGWTTKLAYSTDPYMSSMINSNYPNSGWSDMVFVNGVALTCAASPTNAAPGTTGGAGSVVAGTFYIDYATNTIYIGNNPTGATVEVAQYQNGLIIAADGCVVRGLGLQHYATSYKNTHGIEVNGHNSCTIQNNTVAWCATAGMCWNNLSSGTVQGNTFAFNGEAGISSSGLTGSTITANYFAYNNQRNFSFYWDAAGFKTTQSSNAIISNNMFDTNNCAGIWIDGPVSTNITNITIVGNICYNNASVGIHYEYLCSNGIIANNLVVGGGEAGIEVGGEGINVQVWNNTLSRNNINLKIVDDQRPGDTTGTVIANNIFSNGTNTSTTILDAGNNHNWDKPTPPAASTMITTMDHNGYYRTSTSNPSTMVRWCLGGTNVAYYTTLAAFHSANPNYEAHGIELSNGTANSFFTNETTGNYTLLSSSPAIGAGVALPANIAAAIGVTGGLPVNVGILTMTGPTPVQQVPVITWATPAAITQGTALSAAQLDATASVPGTFSYSPALGTVLSAGTNTLAATFRPTDTTDYTTATATVSLVVNAAPPPVQLVPVITWAAPAPIIYGTGLSSQQLNATASYNGIVVPGAFTYSPAIGTVLQHGPPSAVLSCTFTPTNIVTFATVTATRTINVYKAQLITW